MLYFQNEATPEATSQGGVTSKLQQHSCRWSGGKAEVAGLTDAKTQKWSNRTVPNMSVVKYKYYVSQKQHEFNNKIH